MEVPLTKRSAADPVSPSNIERLEQIFELSPSIMKALIFPEAVKKEEYAGLIRSAYQRYGIMFDTSTAAAYGAAVKSRFMQNRGSETLILIEKDHPAYEADTIYEACGERPTSPKYIEELHKPIKNVKKLPASKNNVKDMLEYMER